MKISTLVFLALYEYDLKIKIMWFFKMEIESLSSLLKKAEQIKSAENKKEKNCLQ